MAWRFPPLNSLRAFEAAGRCQSFTLAAEELHVTPGAVSRQIKALEEKLGVSLFARNNREVRLTPDSKQYLECLTEARSANPLCHSANLECPRRQSSSA